MKDALIIYIDRLRDGKKEHIDTSVSQNFLDVHEADLQFHSPLSLKGTFYLAEDHLILQISLRLESLMRCSICNELTSFFIDIQNLTDTVALSEISGNLYDCRPFLREAILLEVPYYVECNGNCPKRAELTKYLTTKNRSQHQVDTTRFPFADLNHD
ncbi:MAG: hypothetical protein AAF443_02800 [Chlamydiota bacterium]